MLAFFKPKSFGQCLTALGFTFFASQAMANYRVYEAPLDESSWEYAGNPLTCQLSHNIPKYGKAEFRKIAGKNENLAFALGYQRNPVMVSKVAEVRSLAPSWKPTQTSREMGSVKLEKGHTIIRSQETASWRLLNELEVGRYPTFYYQDFAPVEDQVSVALSSVGFQSEYEKFLDCLHSLVPYKLDELAKMTLYFDFDRDAIRSRYKNRLNALAQYIKHDPSLEIVFISGYTDSKGSRSYNEKLSMRRVESVREALTLKGVGENRFKTVAHGERKPAASNRTAQGRAKNRRVYIRIAQN